MADLASVSIGSIAIKRIKIGGNGTAKNASANPIVGSTATPFNPAADMPVKIPKIKI